MTMTPDHLLRFVLSHPRFACLEPMAPPWESRLWRLTLSGLSHLDHRRFDGQDLDEVVAQAAWVLQQDDALQSWVEVTR